MKIKRCFFPGILEEKVLQKRTSLKMQSIKTIVKVVLK